MFFTKTVECKHPEIVECRTCKHIILLKKAQLVKVTDAADWYFCPEHVVAYESVVEEGEYYSYWWLPNGTYRYYKKFEVTEDGAPIGYTKNPPETVKFITEKSKRGRPKGSKNKTK